MFQSPANSDLDLKRALLGDVTTAGLILEMMNLVDAPALLVNSQTEIVQMGNRPILETTAFKQEELAGMALADLLEPFDRKIFGGDEIVVKLTRRKRKPIDISARAVLINPQKSLYAIAFHPVVEIYRDIQNRNTNVYDALIWLAKAFNMPDAEQALKLVMDSIEVIFNTDLACIYRADNSFPRLVKASQSLGDTIFPDILQSSELARLSAINIWAPGKKMTSELHRVARIANLEYLVTAPLGSPNAGSGLIVIGSLYNPPMSNLGDLIELFASMIEAILQHHIFLSTLNNEINLHGKQLAVHKELLAGTKDGVIVITPDLIVSEINPAAEWLLGYAAEEVIGKTIDTILIGPERLFSALETAQLGEPTHNLGDCFLHRRDGSSFPALIRLMPVENESVLLAILIFINDLSEQLESQRNSQQLEHRAILGDFTAIFAHDLRNPINNISTGMQLIQSRIGESDPNYDVVTRVLNDCGRIDHLMESVLIFARSMEPKLERVDINNFMKRLLDRWRPAMMRGNINSVIQVPDVSPIGAGDPRLLDRLFTNLINNAIDAMKITNGGTIAVKVELVQQKNHDQVEISISDTGPGIPDEVRPRLFEPFVTTKSTGTGLGLSICKRIVTVHKGTITVDTFPGGTVFHVFLPIFDGA